MENNYLIIPKKDPVVGTITLNNRKLNKASRSKQVEETKAARRESKVNKDFRHWVNQSKFKNTAAFISSESGGVTGIRVVQMSPADAEEMKMDLPEFTIMRDYPLELIQPESKTLSTAAVNDSDRWHLQAIGLASARQRGYLLTGKNVTIAVMDTGIHATHSELIGKIDKHLTFNGPARTYQSSPGPGHDTLGHGTHVAGLICGQTVGVAPDAKIADYMMIPYGQGQLSDFITALEAAAADPDIQILNMSAGLRGYYPEFQATLDAVKSAGLFLVVATGNEGADRTRSPGNFRDVMSVGACDKNGAIAGFSSSGSFPYEGGIYQVPDLVAPGVGVYSSIMDGGYAAWDGTSMATPITSGIAALILEAAPDIDVLDLENELYASCKRLAAPDIRQGRGMVQVTRVPPGP